MISRVTPLTAIVLLVASVVTAAEPESKEISHRYDSGSIRRVEIELPPSTRLDVRTGEDSVITIDGRAEVRFEGSPSRLKRQAILEGIDVAGEVESSNRLRIVDRRAGAARSGWARRLATDFTLTITVPSWTNVEVHQRDGAVVIDGDLGDVTVGMRAGEIRAVLPKARVKELTARTRVGEVRADLGRITEQREGFLPGATTYENPAGQTTVRLYVTAGEIDVILKE